MTLRYESRYPRHGRVAILCEGDLAGFEADLLEKWTAEVEYVDVWPCGTKDALFGVSDAIGRSVPIVVVEDRDYRSAVDAKKECDSKAKDRRKRAVNIVEWISWKRHEIENYLIEPDVLVPVLCEVFGQPDNVVFARLNGVLATLHVEQAALATRASFSASLPDLNADKFAVGIPRARPIWNSERKQLDPPDVSTVASELEENIGKAWNRFCEGNGAVDIQACLQRFHEDEAQWRGMNSDSSIWRENWAGKEVLTDTLRWLAGEFGWPDRATHERDSVDWSKLKNADAKARDREMLETVQPRLVQGFLRYLEAQSQDGSVRGEWEKLRTLSRSAAGTQSSE